MKYLFVFLLIGLVSCGDDASENAKPKLKEYSMDEVTFPNNKMAFFKKDMKPVTGIVRGWNEDGQLWIEGNYKDGREVGLHRIWHTNGQLRVERNYKDGKRDGLSRGWYENGQLEYEQNFKDGELISERCWDEDGNEKQCD
ncbi:hypothetical protein OAM07_05065 [Crocinitomicaceae bacterium]|nr:hypothetical protein [Crocinitomicaceae bacterium]MDC0460107.1 hypothetical protein [Crocinitomicaceae bacterium]